MAVSHFSRIRAAATLAVALFTASAAHAQLRIGIFDSTRGGNLNFDASSLQNTLRSDILTSFPGATFSATGTITAGFLTNVDVLMLSSARGGSDAIDPLTGAEQSALLNFVLGGKGVVLFPDNDTFEGAASDPANESLIDPFGMNITGTVGGNEAVTVTNPAGNPISNGPFGQISSMTYAFTGFFDSLGPNAQSLATINSNGQSALAYIPKGTLGAGSGGVVVFSDVSMTVDGTLTTNNSIAVRNALAYAGTAVAGPEPGTLALVVFPLCAVVLRRRR